LKRRVETVFVGVGLVLFVALFALPPSAGAVRSLYVTNSTSDEVSGFSIDGAGALALVGTPTPTGSGPEGVALTPGGTHLYVANRDANTVSAYSVAAGGALTEVADSPFPTETAPSGVSASPDGRFLFVTNRDSDSVSGFAIASDGSLGALLGSPTTVGNGPRGVATSPDGRFLYVANSISDDISAFTIAGDGALAEVPVSPFAAGDEPYAPAFTPDGRFLYAASASTDEILGYSVAAGGSLTPVAGSPFPTGNLPFGVAVAPSGNGLFAPNRFDDDISAFAVGVTGDLTPSSGSPFAAGIDPTGAAVTPDGRFLYSSAQTSSDVNGFAITGSSLSLGTTTPTGGTGPDYQSLAIRPNQPPVAELRQGSSPAPRVGAFQAVGSVDPDGQITRYRWDFGDGSTRTTSVGFTTHQYRQTGTYDVTLTLADNEGCSVDRVYTGQTAHCNGSSVAAVTKAFAIGDGGTDNKDNRVVNPRIIAKKSQRQEGRIQIKVKVAAGEHVRAVVAGTVGKAKKRLPLRKVISFIKPRKPRKLILRTKSETADRKLHRLLDRASGLRAKVKAMLTDDAGNRATVTTSVVIRWGAGRAESRAEARLLTR